MSGAGSFDSGLPVSGSLLARRQLGRRLRLLREAARRTIEDVELSGAASHSKLYRIESGRTGVRPGDVRELCALYGVPEEALDPLLALARASKAGSWQEDYEDVLLPGFGLYVDLEAAASTLQAYDPELVHGLLQVSDYARSINATDPEADELQQVRWLEVQQARQRAALDRDPPLRVTQVLGQAALTRVIGSAQILAAQVEHLRALNRLSQVEVRVLPWESGPHPALFGGAFTIMSFASAADPDLVYLESRAAAHYLEQGNQLRRYRRMWGILTRQSVPLEEYLR